MIETEDPNGANKSSKLKHWASKVLLFEILMDFGKLDFFMFWVLAKDGPPKQTNQIFSERMGPNAVFDNPVRLIKLRFWPDSTFLYLTTPDTGRCRRI